MHAPVDAMKKFVDELEGMRKTHDLDADDIGWYGFSFLSENQTFNNFNLNLFFKRCFIIYK